MGMDRWLRPVAGPLLLGAAIVFAPVAKAAETVTVGTVGQASANLWPLFIGLNKGFFFEPTGKVSKSKLASLAKAMVSLGDLPGAIDIDRVLLPGVTQVVD